MNGTKYFTILNHIFSIQEQINELSQNAYTNEKHFLLKLKKRVNMLEKFTVRNWLEFRKDETKMN
jgi:hypothetical protein